MVVSNVYFLPNCIRFICISSIYWANNYKSTYKLCVKVSWFHKFITKSLGYTATIDSHHTNALSSVTQFNHIIYQQLEMIRLYSNLYNIHIIIINAILWLVAPLSSKLRPGVVYLVSSAYIACLVRIMDIHTTQCSICCFFVTIYHETYQSNCLPTSKLGLI